ncbi:RrF2 family transcriptional regulator [Acetobacter ghanensis]|uniref:Rrf2 family transcriptional regulator n=1 Tax=Acetobacter ghanensis TaxID=431306 RepID=A0A0U5F1P2_9PROT|nr:Rrf2 family transcriptional regulator [Acetobacter ghanensis]NHO38735.1 Rrf2 family transcriptional regulator [Acetobacter ghanensis]GBQ50485.1 Rrf2 family transcriptional regulator [Acetobacter ghanensis DSM 18895]CEF54991.1 transcriptional regulator, BadM/Rrf2 family [Acetobacter ghanensis]
MRLTLYTDYALRTLLYLAVHTDRRVSIREVAQTYGISENHLVKIIHHLGRGGFVHTQRGRGGGLTLGRAAEDICVGDVVRHTEEDMALVSCMARPVQENAVTCLLSGGCHLRSVLGTALEAFMGVLDKVTLADLLQPYERRTLMQPENPILP